MAKPTSRVSGVVMTGPLAPFAAAYTSRLQERCYTPLTIVCQLRQVARLSRWLEAAGLTAADLSGGRVEEFLAVQRAELPGTGPRSMKQVADERVVRLRSDYRLGRESRE